MNTKRLLSLAVGGLLLVGLPVPVGALTIIDGDDYPVNQSIRDNDASGVADTQTFVSSILNITSVEVRLSISGGFLGDLYAYVTHETGFSVLLNRVGRTATDAYGSAAGGLDVTFNSGALNGDIHSATGTPTGPWDVDGRNIDPDTVTDGSLQNALLTSFNGMAAAGEWTLFVADVSAVGIANLDSWGLTVTGDGDPPVSVPDGGASALLLGLGLIGLFGARGSMAG